MRVVVTGSRDWTSREAVAAAFRHAVRLHGEIDLLAHGDCRGADRLAAAVALEQGIVPAEAIRAFPADWDAHGKAAGPRRNIAMLDEVQPDLVLAFHDKLCESRGTGHCIDAAQERKIPIYLWGSWVRYTEL